MAGLSKAEREHLQKLYAKLDAIGAENERSTEIPKDVKLLRQLADQRKLVDALKGQDLNQRQAYNDLLVLGYRYYQVSGQVDTKTLGPVSAQDLIQYYQRSHEEAFNLQLQTQIHEFLVQMAPVLMQLQNVPEVEATLAQLENIRKAFQQQLLNILGYGFALDLQYYHQHLESVWLIIKMARHLTADDFKNLVRALDRYSRMRTGQEQQVGYVPDEAHTKKPVDPNSDKVKQEALQQQQQAELQKKQEGRVTVQKDTDGHLIVNLPHDRQNK